ncbi:MAG: hypothetical protein ABH891_02375 [Candidatus Omnitrophota bacterium]
MRKMLWVFVAVIFCGSLLCAAKVHAEESGASTAPGLKKEELAADKEAIKAQKAEMKTHAQAARTEGKSLKKQIKEAEAAGDTAKVKELQAQLQTIYKENAQERHQDRKELGDAKKELRKERVDRNNNGVVDRKEKKMAGKRDKDNNPPGSKGGPGTNWENPPGPKGGPGASPDRKKGR